MERTHELILQALRPGNRTTISTPDMPGVSFIIFVSERFDVLSITTEILGNPSAIRIGVNSQTELVLDENIDTYDAVIAINVYGTLYKEIILPAVDKTLLSVENSLLKTFRLSLQFIEEFVPILERFINDVLSPKAIELHNKAVEQQSWD